MFSRLKEILQRLRALVPSTEELEQRYLNGANSVLELEMREREISAGRFRHGFGH